MLWYKRRFEFVMSTENEIVLSAFFVARHGALGTCLLEFANVRKFCIRSNYGCPYLSAEFS